LSATTDLDEISEWWTRWPNSNIAAVPGRAGFIVIDTDGPAGDESLKRLGLFQIPTLMCRTGRLDGGHHRYFHRPKQRVGNLRVGQNLDVRCDSGYVILPPSRHKSGRLYRWIGRLDDVAVLPESVMHTVTRVVRSDPALSIMTSTQCDAFHQADKRVRAYLTKIGNRAEGDGRNNAAYQLSAWLTTDMALELKSAWAYVVEWNSINVPPLKTKELRSAFLSATRSAKRMKGCANRDTVPLASLPLACTASPVRPGMWR
jgi:hypothetical protein